MTSDYDATALMSFLDYLAEKGIGKPETMKSRRIAVSRVVEALGADALQDLRRVDVDELMERFFNLEGARYSPDSMRTYKSRVNTSVSDFLRYRENPAGFKVQGQRRSRARKEPENGETKDPARTDCGSRKGGKQNSIEENVNGTVDTVDLPVPIRLRHIVTVSGLPHDLKRSEAQRIANIVLAMATDEE
jgi:hypothetical protein